MSPRIVVVGCGFVGSIFTHEALRRLNALEVEWDWGFVDMDTIEERNCNNQNYTPAQAGLRKSTALADYAETFGVTCWEHGEEVQSAAEQLIVEDTQLLVDAVDNLETRQWLWGFGLGNNIPVLHLGITQDGMGKVEWTMKDVLDNFSLSPIALKGRTDVKDPDAELPPCELARMRGVGLLTGFAGAVALGHYFGQDPEGFVPDAVEGTAYLTSWNCTTSSMMLLPDFTVEAPYATE